MGSRRAGRGLERFLEAVGFILAEFELKRSHGDPIRDNFYGFWTRELAQLFLRERYLCLRDRYLRLLFFFSGSPPSKQQKKRSVRACRVRVIPMRILTYPGLHHPIQGG